MGERSDSNTSSRRTGKPTSAWSWGYAEQAEVRTQDDRSGGSLQGKPTTAQKESHGGLCGSLTRSVCRGSAGRRSGKPQKQLECEDSFSVSLALMEDALPEKLVVSSLLPPYNTFEALKWCLCWKPALAHLEPARTGFVGRQSLRDGLTELSANSGVILSCRKVGAQKFYHGLWDDLDNRISTQNLRSNFISMFKEIKSSSCVSWTQSTP